MSQPPLSICRAGEAHRALVFEWVNDPESRANSFTTRPIDWEEHCAWFARLLQDPGRILYVALAGAEPIGYARFESAGTGQADVSIALDVAWRGRRVSAPVIRLATAAAARELGLETVHAYVKAQNDVSVRAFLTAGYLQQGTTLRRGIPAVHLACAILTR